MRFLVYLVTISLLFSVISGFSKQTHFLTKLKGEKCYGVILDAGSSSTKLNIYSWPCREFITLPTFNPKTELTFKVSPGISKFAQDISAVKGYLAPLVEKAKSVVPEGFWFETPITFAATAGMRLLTDQEQANILAETRGFLKQSGFFFKSDNWARVITGQEEGVYLWIATNYLTGAIKNQTDIRNGVQTATTLDLGGASTQIAFQPLSTSKPDLNQNVNILGNNTFSVYSVSYLGYGNDQARNSVVNLSEKNGTDIHSGCFNKGYSYIDSTTNQKVVGTSNPEDCIKNIQKFFNTKSCPTNSTTCSINGNYQPLVPAGRDIIAVSGFHTAVLAFGLKTNFTALELRDQSSAFCRQDFDVVSKQSPNDSYISTRCFLGLYAATLLLDGYKIGNRVIQSPNDIKGAEPSWAMGFVFETVANYRCDDSEVSACREWKRFFAQKDLLFSHNDQ